jgi:RHS repeat-associated protein
MILSDSRRQYSWDAAERLLSISNSGVSNAVKLAFQYYPDGRRAQKTVSCFTNNAWVVTRSLHYAWQGWKLAAECERNGAGTITAVRHFVWGPDIAGQQSASLESGAEGVGGLLLIREWKLGIGIKQYLPLTDGLGNISRLIDATDGSLAAEYDYDPYGGPVIERGIATEACPFRHRTRYYDSESWLYYYGYRYYDPSTTKWISKDPLAEAGGWNLTCFCSNDPVNKMDSLGLWGFDMHFYAVYLALLSSGTSKDEAWLLAYWSATPDIDSRHDAFAKSGGAYMHGPQSQSGRVQQILHQLNGLKGQDIVKMREALRKLYKESKDPVVKGYVLHSLGDTYGHMKAKTKLGVPECRGVVFGRRTLSVAKVRTI